MQSLCIDNESGLLICQNTSQEDITYNYKIKDTEETRNHTVYSSVSSLLTQLGAADSSNMSSRDLQLLQSRDQPIQSLVESIAR